MRIRILSDISKLAILGAMVAACNPAVDDNRSAVITIISEINDGTALNSDVVGNSGILEDEVEVVVQSIAKAPDIGDVSELYTARFTEAIITFVRPDGLNEPGIDVPFPLRQNINVTVAPDSDTTFSLTIVTHLMKEESPLRDLILQGGEKEINATAFIQLRGADLAGNGLVAEGTLPVFFGDFAG